MILLNGLPRSSPENLLFPSLPAFVTVAKCEEPRGDGQLETGVMTLWGERWNAAVTAFDGKLTPERMRERCGDRQEARGVFGS